MAAAECLFLFSRAREHEAMQLVEQDAGLLDLLDVAQGVVTNRRQLEALRKRTASEPVPSALPAMSRFLTRHEGVLEEGTAQAAESHEARIASWLDQRLWNDNLVRELVLHDERHAQRVDALTTQLATPLLLQEVSPLDVAHAEALSAAAWLHDWGHEGGAISQLLTGTDEMIVATEAEEVRRLHGIITRELLDISWKGRHDLAPEMASLVGILSAHHQGWTSFGARRSRAVIRRRGEDMIVEPPSLREDVESHNDGSDRFQRDESIAYPSLVRLDYDRVRLLLALLRVADGCDVGRHRVPDAGPAKEAYLARSVQVRCRHTESALRAMSRCDEQRRSNAVGAVMGVQSEARYVALSGFGPADSDRWEGRLAAQMQDALRPHLDLEPVRRLADYITFAADQAVYYQDHRRVSGVWFEVAPVTGVLRDARYDVTVCVAPSRDMVDRSPNAECHAVVAEYLSKELAREDVTTVLLNAGIWFSTVRNVQTGQEVKPQVEGDL